MGRSGGDRGWGEVSPSLELGDRLMTPVDAVEGVAGGSLGGRGVLSGGVGGGGERRMEGMLDGVE